MAITSTTINPIIHHAPNGIAALDKQPDPQLNILSFLPQKDRENMRSASKTWHTLNQDSRPVENGYGDFLLIDTTGKEVSRETFAKAFASMNNYLPQVHQKPVENRLKEVNRCVKAIDPQLQAVF